MGTTANEKRRYTVSEYYALMQDTEEKMELLDGELVGMASPSIQHQRLTRFLTIALDRYITQNYGTCEVFSAPTDVMLDEYTLVIPDVFVVCHPEWLDAQKYNGAPDFIAEVVSSNRSDDYIKKLYWYQRSGVREYWIVDPKAKKVLVYYFEESLSPTVYPFGVPIPVGIYQHTENPLTITIPEEQA